MLSILLKYFILTITPSNLLLYQVLLVKYNVVGTNAEKVSKVSTNDGLTLFCNLFKVYAIYIIAQDFDGFITKVLNGLGKF